MYASNKSKSYQCDFIDSVNILFYCKKCNLVARRLTLTSCCGESYCHACIADIHIQGKRCPECGEENFNIYEQPKYQQQIRALRVCCSMKESGCQWSGTLELLDTHLDPDQDNCQYVDTKCPLNCHMTIPKNKVEQHVVLECTKRPHVCQHCGFKATYEEVDTHLPECKYVPLQCPNRCGVTCERGDMEDHMKICRLEEVECKFSNIGCTEKYLREEEEDHSEKNTQNHLLLTVADIAKSKQEFQQKFREQEQTIQEQEKKLLEQHQQLKQQATKLQEQEKKFQAEEQHLRRYEQKIDLLEQTLKNLNKDFLSLKQNSEKKYMLLDTMEHFINPTRRFEMNYYSRERKKDAPNDWKSPPMYTHLHGYKFCIGIDANGNDPVHGEALTAHVFSMQGEFDGALNWPVKVEFTIVLLNQRGGKDVECTETIAWKRPQTQYHYVVSFNRLMAINYQWVYALVDHSCVNDFVCNDTLCFCLKVCVL